MSEDPTARGGHAPVSRLDELPELERRLVRALRLWRAGSFGRAALARELEARQGPEVGAAALARFGAFAEMTDAHARRPLRILGVAEPGVAGDECVIARLVALAAEGAREDAILMAALMVRADLALTLARQAMAVGRLMQRRPGAVTPGAVTPGAAP